MINAIIVDDEKENNELLSYFLTKHCENVNVAGICTNLEHAIKMIDEIVPNVVFLDIELSNGTTGFDLIEYIDLDVTSVIFITAYNQYAYQAIKVQALDYLQKPISIVELQEALNKLKQKIDKKKNYQKKELENLNTNLDVIAVSHLNEIQMILKNEIIYIKAEGKYTQFILANNNIITSSRNIKEYEIVLNKDQFIRVHHSFIISISKMKKIIKNVGWFCEMENDFLVPVSRRKKDELYLKLNL